MKIGVLKEPAPENRVILLPEAIESLTKSNVSVLIEKGAGTNSFFNDKDYENQGATIKDRKSLIAESDMILSISGPDGADYASMKEGQLWIGALNPFFNKEMIHKLAQAKVISFSLDMLPRTTRAQAMDILSSMATIAGYKAVLDAAGRLPKFFPMFMSAAGTIKPARLLILGAGVAGLQAIATARKLGAVVEVFDVRSAVKEEVQSLGGKFIEVEGAKEDAAAGGYAVEQTEEFKQKQQQLIQEHAIKSDVVICTAQIPGRKAPLLIKKETVEAMKPGSLVIDLAASTGGNCELTQNDKIIQHNAVSIVGNSRFPSEMPTDASRMFGKNVLNFLKLFLDDNGNLAYDMEDDIVKGTMITNQGEIVNERLKEHYNA